MNAPTNRDDILAMSRYNLEEAVWSLPETQRDRRIGMDMIQAMPLDRLREILLARIARKEAARKRPTKERPTTRRIKTEFVERAGRLVRVETWLRRNAAGLDYVIHEVPCGKQVTWNGHRTSASLVLHYLRTGERVERVPRAPAKRWQAVVRDGARTKHLGYYATQWERDAAVLSWRMQRDAQNAKN